ncbi:MAG TPA: MSHA biogenesis protein MshJ [Burkholderiales bacterium]|nr:MSHA biogenesis protein MshJ [Burkholderiales bacterium]
MKNMWRSYGRKFDALSMRERVMVFAATMGVIVLLGYEFGLSKSLTQNSRLSAQIAQHESEIAISQQQSQILTRSLSQDPNEAVRKQIAALEAQIAERDLMVRGVQKGLVPPTRMAAVLENMLNRSREVQLVSMKTLPVTTLVERPADAARDEGAVAVSADQHQVYKHGVEITLQGNYIDLMDYLAKLEKLPWQMFWAKTRMDASDYPKVRVTLTLYTLSLDKAWLVV